MTARVQIPFQMFRENNSSIRNSEAVAFISFQQLDILQVHFAARKGSQSTSLLENQTTEVERELCFRPKRASTYSKKARNRRTFYEALQLRPKRSICVRVSEGAQRRPLRTKVFFTRVMSACDEVLSRQKSLWRLAKS